MPMVPRALGFDLSSHAAESEQESNIRKQQAMAYQLLGQAPSMGLVGRDLATFLTAGDLPSQLRANTGLLTMAARERMAPQYAQGRESILNQYPQIGGQLNRQLGALGGQYAMAQAQMPANIQAEQTMQPAVDLFANAAKMATGQTPVAWSAMGQGIGQLSQLANASMMRESQLRGQAKETAMSVLASYGGTKGFADANRKPKERVVQGPMEGPIQQVQGPWEGPEDAWAQWSRPGYSGAYPWDYGGTPPGYDPWAY